MAFKFNFSFEEQGTDSNDDGLNSSSSIDLISSSRESGKTSPFAGKHTNDEKTGRLDRPTACKRHDFDACKNLAVDNEESLLSLKLPQNELRPSEIWYLNNNSVDFLLTQKASSHDIDSLKNLIERSDLRSGIYEGGFKVWECSLDLIAYMDSNNIHVTEADILELGCGAGLPGIFCLINGAQSVCFQDFNEEVIDCFTIPNVFLNIKKPSCRKSDDITISGSIDARAEFYSGDWGAVGSNLGERDKKFDLILSSETIYNTRSYPVFHNLICSCMKRNGLALLANKTYYFGVGGSSKEFMEYVEKEGKLKYEIVHQITDGVNRDILKLSWK